ncbi:ATP-binding protein [Legionella sp. PC997]|uniref:ATP-binding protein n=1 Tax=Legionella sp. PC997 TaxID=2755562 RepID=UPI0015FDA8F6|nr:ATP-binding protein [Legionella sp. PC997]QMT59178.1 PAS domain-containing sensor histidine kinase [Legionella sp. PC997]
MIAIDKQALSTILQMAQEPIITVSEHYLISDINLCAEHKFPIKKNQIIGTFLTSYCSNDDLNKLTHASLEQITLLIKKKQYSCYALIVCEEQSKAKAKTDFGEQKPLQKHDRSNPNDTMDNFDYLESIISEIPVSVYWMNRDYVYLGCSNSMAELFNLPSRHDIVGKTYADLYDKKSAAFYKKSDKSVMENGISLSIEEPLYQPDGTKLVYLSNKVPLHGPDGTIIGMLGISTNITERKKMEMDLKLAKEAAEAADRAKTEFIANMGHDIRTPLTGVIGMAELLENALDNIEHKTEAHIIHESGEELLAMLNDILDDAKAGSFNDGRLHQKLFNLYECIDDLIKLERPTTTTKHLGLFVEIDKAIPQKIIGDRKKIQRILLNLLGNSIKFTQSGHITVKVQCVEQNNEMIKMKFSVSDTGIGIPQEFQDKVFDRFFRSTPSYKGVYKGHGLGLHIARTYVHLLGGQITLISKEGVGSTFQFDLQCQTATEKSISSLSQKNEDNSTPSPTPKINKPPAPLPYCLLIEDNATALRVLESLVSKAGCRYLSATNGEDALDLIKSTHFDLIITDIGLPGISGTDFCSLVRSWEKEYNLDPHPIVGLTGHARDTAYKECIASGMNDVFTKPANAALIQKLIDTYSTNLSIPITEPEDTVYKDPGADLPATEEDLFQLEQFELLHIEEGIKNCGGNESLFKNMLYLMVTNEIPSDLEQMKLAFSKQDFTSIEKLAHKIKGGSVYLGLRRMKYACQYVERYWKTGQRELFEELYFQAVSTIGETSTYIEDWLRRMPHE